MNWGEILWTIHYSYAGGNSPVSMEVNGTEYYFLKNAQGDVTHIVDGDGNEVASYEYDAWGNHLSITGGELAELNPYRYRGYRYDSETGLYYLQSRYYNPEWGRFINGDALLGVEEFAQLFAYCFNDPVNGYDPDGLYDRKAAVKYARKHCRMPNISYYRYKYNCANFVSQCLFAGGIPMDEEWHSNSKLVVRKFGWMPMYVYREWQIAPAWRIAGNQYHYFKSSSYFSEEIIISARAGKAGIKAALSYYTIQAGDIMYFDYTDNGKLNHAVIISKVDNGMIYYAGNTKARFDEPLSNFFKKNKTGKVYILTFK